jgi:enoyl-CoA hydratase
MKDTVLLSHVVDSTLWITLNRPASLNALNEDLLEALEAVLTIAETDNEVRAVVLTGKGRAFCAGADLKEIQARGSADSFLGHLNTTLNRLEKFPKPVVAMVNGLALAGGLELVLCCDLVVAAQSASLGDGHAMFGLLPGGGASVRLPRKIGSNRAKYLFFTGESISAETLFNAGLVNLVVADEQLREATTAMVIKITSKSPLGLSHMKKLVNDGLEQSLENALRLEAETVHQYQKSNDMREGLQAFQSKRRPQFKGT